jgi:hypothetical protein
MSTLSGLSRTLDVFGSAVPQLTNLGAVFLFLNVVMRLLQRLDGAQQAAAMLSHIDHRMIIEVLAMVNRGPLDFVIAASIASIAASSLAYTFRSPGFVAIGPIHCDGQPK